MSAAVRRSVYLDAALDLAERGFYVFPCGERRKEPLRGSHGFKDATRDEQEILHAWDPRPGANIGIDCGASGIAVVDIDTKYGADPAEAIPALGLDEFLTAMQWTGEAPGRCPEYPDSLPGVRGAHVLFRGRARTGALAVTGCELRGEGAYIVVAPSVHPSGVPYQWHRRKRPPSVFALPELPAHLEQQRKATARELPQSGAKLPGGRRHEGLVATALDLVARGVTDEDVIRGALLEVNSRRCLPPKPSEEVAAIAAWAVRSEKAERARQADAFFERAQRNGARP